MKSIYRHIGVVHLSSTQTTLNERIGNFLIKPWTKVLDTIWTTALFAIIGIIYTSTNQNLLATGVYTASVFLTVSYLRFQAHRAEQRVLERTRRNAWYRRLTYERAAEVISPSQFSLLDKINNSIAPISSDEEKRFINTFVEDLLEDLTTRIFEADIRASDYDTDRWAGQSFKATLMVNGIFTQKTFENLRDLIQNDKDLSDSEKQSEIQRYEVHVNKHCMFIKYWYYPGNAHPESLGIPYILNEGVAGLAWFKKSLMIWTPEQSCTPRLRNTSNIFEEKYRGQQDKYASMVCVPIESYDKNKKFLPSTNTSSGGVLGVLTITCERNNYFIPDVDFAKYLQTLLAPSVVILSYALERVYGKATP